MLYTAYKVACFSHHMDAPVNTPVFCADLKLEFVGKTVVARLVCVIVNKQTKGGWGGPPELYFN